MATLSKFDVLTSLGAASRTTEAEGPETFSGAAVNLVNYINPGGRQLKAVLNIGAITSTGTLNVKIQESATSAEAGFSDVSGAAFTATADSGSLTGSEAIHFRTNNQYVRALATIADTGNIDFGVYIVAEKKLV